MARQFGNLASIVSRTCSRTFDRTSRQINLIKSDCNYHPIFRYYCVQGTIYSKRLPCPAGTYNDVEGRAVPSDCKPCPSGFYCPEASETGGEAILQFGIYQKLQSSLPIPPLPISPPSQYLNTAAHFKVILPPNTAVSDYRQFFASPKNGGIRRDVCLSLINYL